MILDKLYYNHLKTKSAYNLGNLPRGIIGAIYITIMDNNMSNLKGRCVEISRYLCDEINKVEPNSAIVVCCRGFWIDKSYTENDLARYLHHSFVKYKDYYIDLTLKQFESRLPAVYISKSHLGNNQYLHQTYPEIKDLNYVNTLNNHL